MHVVCMPMGQAEARLLAGRPCARRPRPRAQHNMGKRGGFLAKEEDAIEKVGNQKKQKLLPLWLQNCMQKAHDSVTNAGPHPAEEVIRAFSSKRQMEQLREWCVAFYEARGIKDRFIPLDEVHVWL